MKILAFKGHIAAKDQDIEDHFSNFQQTVNQFPDLKAKYFPAFPYFL